LLFLLLLLRLQQRSAKDKINKVGFLFGDMKRVIVSLILVGLLVSLSSFVGAVMVDGVECQDYQYNAYGLCIPVIDSGGAASGVDMEVESTPGLEEAYEKAEEILAEGGDIEGTAPAEGHDPYQMMKNCLESYGDGTECSEKEREAIQDASDELNTCLNKCKVERVKEAGATGVGIDIFCRDSCKPKEDAYNSIRSSVEQARTDWRTGASGSSEITTGREFKDILKNLFTERKGEKNAERTFRPLFGRVGGEGVSINGYPDLSFISSSEQEFSIVKGDDGKIYLISSDGSRALLEGIGVYQGEEEVMPSITPGLLTLMGGEKKDLDKNDEETVGENETEEKEEYNVKVKGFEGVGDVTIEKVIDPETGEESYVANINVDENAEVGEQGVEMVVEKDGEVIEEIPLVVDVQPSDEDFPAISEPQIKIKWGRIAFSLIGLTALISALTWGIKFALRVAKAKNMISGASNNFA